MTSDAEMEYPEEVLNVDFEGRPADDSDIDGIKILLRQLFLMSPVDCYELAKLIISQNYIGSVLHQVLSESDDEEDEDENMNEDSALPVFGLLTAINLTEKDSFDVIKNLKSYLMEKCKESCTVDICKEFESMLNNKEEQIGFIINERILASSQLAVPNFESLWKDIDKANKKHMKYNFSKYVMLTRSSTTMSNKNKKKGGGDGGPVEYLNPEDQIFHEHSILSFDYSVQGEHDTLIDMNSSEILNQQQEPLRSVIVFEANELPVIMNEMKTL